ncbi:MAG: zinc finger domain-containing protein [Methanosarcinales archaeon]
MAKSRVTKCVSCNVDLVEPGFVRFPCPICGTELGRCRMCRHQSIPYSCPSCGFEGP